MLVVAVLQRLTAVVVEKKRLAARHAQLHVGREAVEQVREVIGPEGEVGVELDDEVPRDRVEPRETVVERVDDPAAERAVTPVGPFDDFDPVVLPRVAVDDLTRSIGRAVVDDHPAQRQLGLRDHRVERARDRALFVACRRDDSVAPVHGSSGPVRRAAVRRAARRSVRSDRSRAHWCGRR